MKRRLKIRVAKSDLGSLVIWCNGERATVTQADINDWGYVWVGGELLDLQALKYRAG